MAAPIDAPGPRVGPHQRACAWFEPPVDCAPCGACCREAFDAVAIEPDDPTADAHPDLVVVADDGWRSVRRVPSPTAAGTRCAALTGDGAAAPYRCSIYGDRPLACRDLAPGSANCLLARRRVGLSAGEPTGPTH